MGQHPEAPEEGLAVEGHDCFVLDSCDELAFDTHSDVDQRPFTGSTGEAVDQVGLDGHRVPWSGHAQVPDAAASVYPRACDQLELEHTVGE